MFEPEKALLNGQAGSPGLDHGPERLEAARRLPAFPPRQGLNRRSLGRVSANTRQVSLSAGNSERNGHATNVGKINSIL